MENRGFKIAFRIFYFIHLPNKEDYERKFLKQLHAQVLEKMLEGEMDDHLGYEKNSMAGNNTGNSRNGSYPKKIHTGHGESVISIPRDRNGQFEPIAVPKHESRGFL